MSFFGEDPEPISRAPIITLTGNQIPFSLESVSVGQKFTFKGTATIAGFSARKGEEGPDNSVDFEIEMSGLEPLTPKLYGTDQYMYMRNK